MKRIILIALAMMMAFSVSCGKEAKDSAEKNEPKKTENMNVEKDSYIDPDSVESSDTSEILSTVQIIYSAEDADFEASAEYISDKLVQNGFENFCIHKFGNDGVAVSVAGTDDVEEVIHAIGPFMGLSFSDFEGNIVLTQDHLLKAEPFRDDESGQWLIQLSFNEEGRKRFADATERVAELAQEGNNYIEISMDDTILSKPYVTERIDSEKCMINGAFTESQTQELAMSIQAGIDASPFRVEEISYDLISSDAFEKYGEYSGTYLRFDLSDNIDYNMSMEALDLYFREHGYSDYVFKNSINSASESLTVIFDGELTVDERAQVVERAEEAEMIISVSTKIEKITLSN